MMLLAAVLICGSVAFLVGFGYAILDQAWDDWLDERPGPYDQAHRVRK